MIIFLSHLIHITNLTKIIQFLVEAQNRWQVISRSPKIRGSWMKEEDLLLEELVKKGFKFWREISSQMPGRTPKQCRERWQQNLQPSLSKAPFTPQEDEKIIHLSSIFGMF